MPNRRAPSPKRPLLPTCAHTHALLSNLAEHPAVTGCFVGYKKKGGRHTRSLAVVCAVQEKRPHGRLRKDELIPKRVEWRVNSRETARVQTDVQEIGESGFQSIAAGPGDLMTVGPVISTIGVALRHPRFGAVVTTAGHAVQDGPGTVEFAPEQRPALQLRNVAADGSQSDISGVLLRSARVPQADYALIAVEPGVPVANLYHDVNTLGGLHVPQAADLGKTCFALTAQGVIPTVVRGVFGRFDIGGFTMRDLILTDPVTEGGDSGCALIDPAFGVMGLLVGFTTVEGERRSVFMSAFWALTLEQSELL